MKLRWPWVLLVLLGIAWMCSASVQQSKLDRALLQAVMQNDEVRAEHLLKSGANPNLQVRMRRETSGWRFFLAGLAVGRWQWSEPKPLGGPVSMGIFVYGRDWTSLLDFVYSNNQIRMMRLLLRHGVDVNATDSLGCTTLPCAVRAGQLEVVKLLLDHGADANVRYFDGESALSTAQDRRYDQIVKLLRQAGAKE